MRKANNANHDIVTGRRVVIVLLVVSSFFFDNLRYLKEANSRLIDDIGNIYLD